MSIPPHVLVTLFCHVRVLIEIDSNSPAVRNATRFTRHNKDNYLMTLIRGSLLLDES